MSIQDIPQYTARNSERWQHDHGKANKYLSSPVRDQLIDDRQARIRKAVALRQCYWLNRDCDVAFTGTAFERGCHRILSQALTVRSAESLEALFERDRKLSGLIEGARAFDAINLWQYDQLQRLRCNAFDLRYQELMKCRPPL